MDEFWPIKTFKDLYINGKFPGLGVVKR